MPAKEPAVYTLNDAQLARIVASAGVPSAGTPKTRQYLKDELLRLREELLKVHAWSPEGAQSTLRVELSGLPSRLSKMIQNFDANEPRSLVSVLLKASEDQHFGSDKQAEEIERTSLILDRLSGDLRHVSSLIDYLKKRLDEYDFLQTPRGSFELFLRDESESAKYLHSMSGLFRRFKQHDSLDLPLVLALIVLSRLFEQLFPGHSFNVRAQYSKNGDAILNDLRYDTPGVRFAAVALKELRLKHVFKKSTLEEYMNAIGDGWNNHKKTIASRASLIPNPLH